MVWAKAKDAARRKLEMAKAAEVMKGLISKKKEPKVEVNSDDSSFTSPKKSQIKAKKDIKVRVESEVKGKIDKMMQSQMKQEIFHIQNHTRRQIDENNDVDSYIDPYASCLHSNIHIPESRHQPQNSSAKRTAQKLWGTVNTGKPYIGYTSDNQYGDNDYYINNYDNFKNDENV